MSTKGQQSNTGVVQAQELAAVFLSKWWRWKEELTWPDIQAF